MCGRITMLTQDEILDVAQAIKRQRATQAARDEGRWRAGAGPDAGAGAYAAAGAGAGAYAAAGAGAGVPTTAGQGIGFDEGAGAERRSLAKPGSLVQAVAQWEGVPSVYDLTWGITAPWGNKLVFNTRLESALGGTAMWQRPIREGRCILPAATFFEPHATEKALSPKTGRIAKQQYAFAMADGSPLLLASIADQGRLSVVTTQPNAAVSSIHPRMPLVLRFEEVPVWLEGDLADIERLADRATVALTSAKEMSAGTVPRAARDGMPGTQAQLRLEF